MPGVIPGVIMQKQKNFFWGTSLGYSLNFKGNNKLNF